MAVNFMNSIPNKNRIITLVVILLLMSLSFNLIQFSESEKKDSRFYYCQDELEKLKEELSDLEDDLKESEAKIKQLESELEDCQYQKQELEDDLSDSSF